MITDYFEDRGIEYWSSGKNVTKGWINIQCIFCDDHSNHLGLKIENRTGYYNCWLCKEHGPLEQVIAEIEQCSFKSAMRIIKNFDIWENDFSLSDVVENRSLPPSLQRHEVVLPPILNGWPHKYIRHLKKRKFNYVELTRKYKLMPAHRFGRYSHRIIVPFFVNNKMVTFTGMDVTGKKEVKYKDCSIKDSIIPGSETCYNVDRIKGGKVVVVEGVTDVWRVGDGAVALGTNRMTDAQLLQLLSKGIKKALVLLDADAVREAEIISYMLNASIKEVDIGYLERDEEDPDKLPVEELLRVQKWLS